MAWRCHLSLKSPKKKQPSIHSRSHIFLMPLVSNISGVMLSNMCPLTRPSLNTARYALNDLDVTQSQTCSTDQFATGILLISEDGSERCEERYCGMARWSLRMM